MNKSLGFLQLVIRPRTFSELPPLIAYGIDINPT